MSRIQPTAEPVPARVRLERTLLVVGVLGLGYNLRGSISSLPPVFADVKSFQFGFVVETKDEAKTKDDKTKTANGTAK